MTPGRRRPVSEPSPRRTQEQKDILINDKKQIDYVTCVIGALALMTGKSCALIYKTLQSAGIIKNYLAAAYDVLHTFSLEYVAEDVIELLKKKDILYVSLSFFRH